MINLGGTIARMQMHNAQTAIARWCIDVNEQDFSKGRDVVIHGSFCNFTKGHDHIAIVVTEAATNQKV